LSASAFTATSTLEPDIEIAAKEIMRIRQLLDEILGEKTGQPLEKVSKDTDRDFIMDADESKAYGIVDEVIQARRAQEARLRAS
jgi:ATP-dependent Clp protease, protease subunit